MRSMPYCVMRHLPLAALIVLAALSCKVRRNLSTSNPAMTGFMSFDAKENDAFKAVVECNIKCRALPKRSFKLEAVYAPKQRGLHPGNGQMWGSMAHDLESFASESCMIKAQTECKGLAAVEALEVSRLSSGKWSMTVPLGCRPDQPVLSPFDPESGAISAPFHSREDSVEWPFAKAELPAATAACKHWINATTCYGDCLVEVKDGKWQQTIASSNPLATDSEKFCGDALVARFHKEHIKSPDVQALMCRHYFWENLINKDKRNMALACAAYRAVVDCSSVIDARGDH